MLIKDLTKKQLEKLNTLPRGMITKIFQNTGVARSTIDGMRWKGRASEETITKVFNYLNEKKCIQSNK